MNYLIRGTEHWDEEHRHLLARKIADRLNGTYYRLSNHDEWDTVAVYDYDSSDDSCQVYANCLNTVMCEEIFVQDLETQ